MKQIMGACEIHCFFKNRHDVLKSDPISGSRRSGFPGSLRRWIREDADMALFWLSDGAWPSTEPHLPQNRPGGLRVDNQACPELVGRVHALTVVVGCPSAPMLAPDNVSGLKAAPVLLERAGRLRYLLAGKAIKPASCAACCATQVPLRSPDCSSEKEIALPKLSDHPSRSYDQPANARERDRTFRSGQTGR